MAAKMATIVDGDYSKNISHPVEKIKGLSTEG